MRIQAIITYRFFIEVLSKILSVASLTLIVRELGVSELGLIVFANALASFFYPLLSLGLASSIVRFFPPIKSRYLQILLFKKIIFLVLNINVVFFVVNYFLIPLIFKSQFDNFANKLSIALWICLTIFVFSLENLILEFQRGIHQLQRYLIFQNVQVATLFSVSFAQTFLNLTLYEFLFLLILLRILVLLSFVVLTFKSFKVGGQVENPIQEKDSNHNLRSMIKFGVPMSIAGLGNWLMGLSDRLVVAQGLNLDKLGVYGAVNSVAMIFPAVSSGFFLLAYPKIVSVIDENQSKLILILRTYSKVLSYILIPICTVVLLSGKSLLDFLLPDSDSETLIVFSLCIIASTLHQWTGLTSYILAAKNRVKAIRNNWILVGLFNFGMNLIFIQHFGLIGVAVINLLSYLLLDFTFIILTKRQLDTWLFFDWRALFQTSFYCIFSLTCSFSILSLLNPKNISMIILGIMFLMIYTSLVSYRHRLEISQALRSFNVNQD